MVKRFRLRLSAAATCTALLAAAFAAAAAAQDDDDADADAPREPRSCLNQAEIRRTTVFNDRTIVFVTRFEEIYRNELPKNCPGLHSNSIVSYPITAGRSCAGDRVQVLWEQQPGTYLPRAMCPLGYFVPITEAELEDLVAMTESNRDRRRRSRREAVTTEQIELPSVPGEPAASAPAETAAPSE